MDLVYMDYQATTPLEKEVIDAINKSLTNDWGNPSSSYPIGKMAKETINKARTQVSKMINATDSNIIFTSGGTESNNMVIHTAITHFHKSLKFNNKSDLKPHIITSNIEHDSVVKALEYYEKEGKIDVTYVGVSHTSGHVEVENILSAVRPTTCLVTVMMANNETGILQPIVEISHAVRNIRENPNDENCKPRILLHTDAGQAIGKVPVDVCKLGIDYLTIVGHKFYGPRIGALYFNKATAPLYPMFFGGGQENNFRPGTENTGMIAGLGKAAELICLNLNTYASHMQTIRDYLETRLLDEFGEENIAINGKFNTSDRIPNVCNVSFCGSGKIGQDILSKCKVLQASVGAACHSGEHHKPSPILLAIGICEKVASSAIRLSVGRYTTQNDIDIVVKDLVQALK